MKNQPTKETNNKKTKNPKTKQNKKLPYCFSSKKKLPLDLFICFPVCLG